MTPVVCFADVELTLGDARDRMAAPTRSAVPHDEHGPIARHEVRASETVRAASGMIGTTGLY